MKRLVRKAEATTPEEFIQECRNSRKFDKGQMYEIEMGFYNGLTVEQVKIYAKPEFDGNQMYEIMYGLKDGFDVSIYAEPEFDADQMEEIYWGVFKEIDVSEYADPTISAEEMRKIRRELEEEKYGY